MQSKKRDGDKPGWMDLWLRIRFTRTQLLFVLSLLVVLVAGAYLAWNYSSLQDLWNRRKAIDRIHVCRELLAQVQETPKPRADLLAAASSQIRQAEQALEDRQYLRSISYAQQGIDLLEEELKWIEILQTGRAARFERIDGSVQVRQPGKTDWESANPDTEIEEDSEIRTGRDGHAKIRFDNGASTDITPDSLLIVRRLAVDAQNRTFENDVRLEQGSIEYRSQRRSDASQVEVPSGQFRSTGAVHVKAAYRKDQPRPASIEVLEGQGQFADLKGNLVALGPMTRVHVAADGSVTRAKPILAPPELISPATASSLHFPTDVPIEVTFRWSPVTGAVRYQLELSTSSRFDRIVEQLQLDEFDVTLDRLAEGIYWWRVRSLDADGIASEPSAYRSLRIQVSEHGAQARAEGPKIRFERIKFLSRNAVLVEGNTTFGVQLFINDQPISIELSGHFRDIITIKDGARNIHIDAVDPDGNQTSYSLDVNS